MPMIVRTDRTEYSRYTSANTVQARITGAQPNEALDVALVRADGFGDVVLRKVQADGGGSALVNLSLVSTTAAVAGEKAAAAADGINYARQGRYSVEARGASTVRSSEITVNVVTVEEFRRSYLFGVPLHAEEMLMPINQPKAITGARVIYVDNGMLKGRGALTYTAANRQLSWRGGQGEAVIGSEPQTLRLLTPEQDAYIELQIEPADLPTANATDQLLIDNWRLGDEDLRRYLWEAYAWVQQRIGVRLEATITTTDPGTSYYDEIADAIPLERGLNRTVVISSPTTKPLLAVRSLTGWYAGQKAMTIPAEWITIQEKGAVIELLPISGSALIASPIIGVWGWNVNALRSGSTIQDFWHFEVVAGLRALEGGRYSIREAIGKVAAINALIDLSVGASGGRSSRQASREGVSESWSFNGQGAYAEKFTQYQQWVDQHLPRMRQWFGGLSVVTL